ncbi:unnamed protein product, partial [Ectocarpus fasciculatus]
GEAGEPRLFASRFEDNVNLGCPLTVNPHMPLFYVCIPSSLDPTSHVRAISRIGPPSLTPLQPVRRALLLFFHPHDDIRLVAVLPSQKKKRPRSRGRRTGHRRQF